MAAAAPSSVTFHTAPQAVFVSTESLTQELQQAIQGVHQDPATVDTLIAVSEKARKYLPHLERGSALHIASATASALIRPADVLRNLERAISIPLEKSVLENAHADAQLYFERLSPDTLFYNRLQAAIKKASELLHSQDETISQAAQNVFDTARATIAKRNDRERQEPAAGATADRKDQKTDAKKVGKAAEDAVAGATAAVARMCLDEPLPEKVGDLLLPNGRLNVQRVIGLQQKIAELKARADTLKEQNALAYAQDKFLTIAKIELFLFTLLADKKTGERKPSTQGDLTAEERQAVEHVLESIKAARPLVGEFALEIQFQTATTILSTIDAFPTSTHDGYESFRHDEKTTNYVLQNDPSAFLVRRDTPNTIILSFIEDGEIRHITVPVISKQGALEAAREGKLLPKNDLSEATQLARIARLDHAVKTAVVSPQKPTAGAAAAGAGEGMLETTLSMNDTTSSGYAMFSVPLLNEAGELLTDESGQARSRVVFVSLNDPNFVAHAKAILNVSTEAPVAEAAAEEAVSTNYDYTIELTNAYALYTAGSISAQDCIVMVRDLMTGDASLFKKDLETTGKILDELFSKMKGTSAEALSLHPCVQVQLNKKLFETAPSGAWTLWMDKKTQKLRLHIKTKFSIDERPLPETGAFFHVAYPLAENLERYDIVAKE